MYYVTPEEALVIHALIIDATGGRHGVRDIGLLESACERPASSAFGKELYPDIFQKAAVYLHAFAMHHVFTDGNKRSSVAIAIRFLERNSYVFTATNAEVEKYVVALVVNHYEIPEIAFWLKKHSKKI